MATSMTLSQLRGLARLYRQDVDGAAQMLMSIIKHNAHELPNVLGFPMKNLDRLRDHDDPVEVLVATIEAAPRLLKEMRDKLAFETAASMAVRLADTAERRAGGHRAFDVALLAETLGRYPGRIITFGTRGSVGAGRLRAILRELRGVRATSVVLTNEHVVVGYEAERARGLIHLVLHEPVVDYDTLVVPIDMRTSYAHPQDELARAAEAEVHGYVAAQTVQHEAAHVAQAEPLQPEHASMPCEPSRPETQEIEVCPTPEPDPRDPYEDPGRSDDAAGGAFEVDRSVDTPETLVGHPRGSAVRRAGPVPNTSGRSIAVRVLDAIVAAALGGGP